MSDKVYVITKGDYSEYHICAVTLDERRATNLNRLFDGKIEEWTLDEAVKDDRLFVVEFPEDAPPKVRLPEYDYEYMLYGGETNRVVDWYGDCDVVFVLARDEGHAMKIAQDVYARWKAEKEGIA